MKFLFAETLYIALWLYIAQRMFFLISPTSYLLQFWISPSNASLPWTTCIRNRSSKNVFLCIHYICSSTKKNSRKYSIIVFYISFTVYSIHMGNNVLLRQCGVWHTKLYCAALLQPPKIHWIAHVHISISDS